MNFRKVTAITGLALSLFTGNVLAQNALQSGCKLDLPKINAKTTNIFSAQQEQELGDAFAELAESDLVVAKLSSEDEVTRVGNKLLGTLPHNDLQYRFHIYESGDVNAFSLSGGRIYISRKLIAAVENEDELAGVLAHEIGHIWTHQTAMEISRALSLRLGVNKVGDRDDIFAKVHQLMDTPPNSKEKALDDEEQIEADRVAIYALVQSGYAPNSFTAFLNRVSLLNGKSGSWLTDFFGLTKEANRRYRLSLKLTAALPEPCKNRTPATSQQFQSWQKDAANNRIKMLASNLGEDKPIKLDPALRSNLWNIRFSPDGKYILAQDEGTITVIDRAGETPLFRIDAPDADEAHFAPDSQTLAFTNNELRVERWAVASKQRISVKEVVIYGGCYQRYLSKDSKTLVCITLNPYAELPELGFRLIDVDSGKTLYAKDKLYEIHTDMWGPIVWTILSIQRGAPLVTVVESPDGRYMLLTIASHAFAYDFRNSQQVQLEGNLKGLIQHRMSFVASNRLVVAGKQKNNGMFELKTYSFPQGELLAESEIGNQSFEAATQDGSLIISGLKDYNVGIFDLTQNKPLYASKLFSMDIWNSICALENASGGILLTRPGTTDKRHIALETSPLPRPRSATISPDGKYLAYSLSSRAAVWDVKSGKQVSMIRPFRSVWFDDHNAMFGQFPKFLNWDAEELKIELSPLQPEKIAKIEGNPLQFRNLELQFVPLSKDKTIWRHSRLEAKKMGSTSTLWTREFSSEIPVLWPAADGRLLLSWDLGADAVKGEVKEHPELRSQLDAIKNRGQGLLVEVISPENGNILQSTIVPEADLTYGRADKRKATVSGDFLLVQGEHSNTAIYRLNDGSKVGDLFGILASTAPSLNLIAAVNRDNEVVLAEEKTGRELKRFTFESAVRLVRIVNQQEKVLLVLTSDQVMHRLPLP